MQKNIFSPTSIPRQLATGKGSRSLVMCLHYFRAETCEKDVVSPIRWSDTEVVSLLPRPNSPHSPLFIHLVHLICHYELSTSTLTVSTGIWTGSTFFVFKTLTTFSFNRQNKITDVKQSSALPPMTARPCYPSMCKCQQRYENTVLQRTNPKITSLYL